MLIDVSIPEITLMSLRKQSRSLGVILSEEFGTTFTFYEATTGTWISDRAPDDSDQPVPGDLEKLEPGTDRENARVLRLPDNRFRLILPLGEAGNPSLLAVGEVVGFARTYADAVQEQQRLRKWAQSVCDRLQVTTLVPRRTRKEGGPEGSGAFAWETLMALEHLLRRVRVHKESGKYQKRILRSAAEQLRVQAVVWVPQEANGQVQIGGESRLSPWDCQQLALRLSKSPDLDKSGFLMNNEVQHSSLGACFPSVINLMALALREPGNAGMLIALNKKEQLTHSCSGERSVLSVPGSDTALTALRRSDAAAMTPFAALFGLHLGAARRYNELKELLVGLTRSLTAAIDAKDAYTYGHSERVGRIAVELGRELGLQEEELSDLYLAGLLHDIGKIGIRDEVLCKRGPLTTEEFDHLKQHVTIGYNILADLHPLHNILPGVLHHHERYDGKGYPSGLRGDAIPFLARILAVADGYDAMSTNRPYRTALSIERVEHILREGAGTQWDAQVIEAFLRARQKVCAVRQRGIGESLRQAISGALRQKGSSQGVTLRPTLDEEPPTSAEA